MAASWVAIAALVITVITIVWGSGRVAGRIEAAIRQLTSFSADHENRIRDLEAWRGRHRR